MNTYTLKVLDVIKETNDTISICFKQPALRKIKYKAGQYLTLIFRINGRRYIRPYSFSSSPSVDDALIVTVKRVPNGIVSNHIHDVIKTGDTIEVLEPLGDFIINQSDETSSFCFWGAGSGITPLYAMIKEILHTNNSTSVYLIYGNRDPETTIFRDSIKSLSAAFPENLKVWYFNTNPSINQQNPFIIEGRINREFAVNMIKNNSLENAIHYICGPTGLKESVKSALLVFDVLPSKIYSEDFELIKDPKDFENIHTRSIKLTYGGEEHTLEVIKGQSILETALDMGLELPYSCQTGNCNTCRGRIKRGELTMIGLEKDRTDLKPDEYLLCCSYPLSDDVYLEV